MTHNVPITREHRVGLAIELALAAAILCFTGCAPASFDRSSDGQTVYIAELSDAAKAEARNRIVQSLNHGVGIYRLGVGDEVAVFFHVDRAPTVKQYRINAGDKLRVDFLGDAENGRLVQVQPDGRIALPLIGPVLAAGLTADALAAQLERRYKATLPEAKITVNISETHTPLEDFVDVLGSSAAGRSLTQKVLPDGTISLPLLPAIQVNGRTLADVQAGIDAAYRHKKLAVYVSLVPHKLRSSSTLVVGEVNKPGQIALDQPTTVLMAVAQAGGPQKTGAMDAVRLYYVGDDGVQHLRSINLDDELANLSLENDTIVPPNSIIYVPPTDLVKTGRFLDATVRDILMFQGVAIGAGFQVAPPSQNGNVTIFNAPAAK